jgi:hypothetical protein
MSEDDTQKAARQWPQENRWNSLHKFGVAIRGQGAEKSTLSAVKRNWPAGGAGGISRQ